MVMPPDYHESLPYIDPEPSDEALAEAKALIAAEAASSSDPNSTPSTLLPPLRLLRLTPALSTEIDRISSSTPLTPLSLARYEAPELPSSPSASAQPALERAAVSASYLAARRSHLVLLDRHGAPAWLLANYHAEQVLRRLERELEDTRSAINERNYERSQNQTERMEEMQAMEKAWREGVGRVLETELAVAELKGQIMDEMRAQALEVAPNAA